MLRKLLLTSLIACLLAPAAAQASPSNLSIMMDDDLLLYRGDQTREQTMQRMRSLGVDTVRVSVLWSVVAEKTARKLRRADDPKSYPLANWDRYDNLARACKRWSMTCYFNVTPPGPGWAHRRAPRKERANRKTWRPIATEFGKFVRAVGRRYSGTYADENGGVLPRVSFWAIGNEPNQQGWLTPQWERRDGVRYNAAAKQYRDLWRSGRAALRRTGHDKDTILVGETAPLGSRGHSSRSPTHPKTFIRELFCLDSRNRRFTGRAAKVRGCSRVPTFGATAFAHHAYTKTLAPSKKDRDRNSITMANIADLSRLLDTAARRTRKVRAGMPTMITEFGYETRPPDPFSKVTPEQQAQYINEADYMAYRNPRILANTQFLLRDVAPQRQYEVNSKKYWFTYQSGLFDEAGAAKPAAAAYSLPLVITRRSGSTVSFWGQLRFVGDGLPTSAQLQFRSVGGSWQPAGAPFAVTDRRHYFQQQRTAPGPGAWRVVWTGAGQTIVSREIVSP